MASETRAELEHDAGSGKRRPRHRILLAIFVALAVTPDWMSLGDHPLNGRSEGRYAAASLEMARTGDLLVPRFMGQAHLTKPPLVYWLEALSVRVFGPTEFAVRAPSALAGTLLVIGLLWFGRRAWGLRAGVLAAGVYSVMPLHVVISRMTVTDAHLALCWFGVLAFGFLGLRAGEGRRGR